MGVPRLSISAAQKLISSMKERSMASRKDDSVTSLISMLFSVLCRFLVMHSAIGRPILKLGVRCASLKSRCASIGEKGSMQKSKQATLFRSWGGKKPLSDGNARYRGKGKAPARWSGKNPPCQDASAKNAPSASYSSNNAVFVDLTEGEEFGFKDVQELDRFFEDDVTEEIGGERAAVAEPATSAHNSSVLEEVPGFDHAAGEQWIYPINYPVRDYQFNIVQKCLFRNTLVCLPTGLGKTFIAAVVMFNFYRWYPAGKVVFMAPTKPLVTQQIEACHNIMGIPQIHLAEMTGE